jgi:hypothetical protein
MYYEEKGIISGEGYQLSLVLTPFSCLENRFGILVTGLHPSHSSLPGMYGMYVRGCSPIASATALCPPASACCACSATGENDVNCM